MDCGQYRETHPRGGAEAVAHEASCAECRALARAWNHLTLYPDLETPPGFVASLRRRLAPRLLRLSGPVVAAAAAFLLALFVGLQPPPPSTEERELLENWELIENFDLLQHLEVVGENHSAILEERR